MKIVRTKISQKVRDFFLKKHIYCKYTEMKLILIFDVIPPLLQRTGSSYKKKYFF
jgi:hypothetical protein